MAWCPNPDCPHRVDTGAPAEFTEGTLQCAECGTPLSPTAPVDAPPAESLAEPVDGVTVATFRHQHEAEVARLRLGAEGIGATIVGRIVFPPSEGIELQVSPDTAVRARMILMQDEATTLPGEEPPPSAPPAGGAVSVALPREPEPVPLVPRWLAWLLLACALYLLYRATR